MLFSMVISTRRSIWISPLALLFPAKSILFGLFLSQRKYVLDLLTETGLLGTRPSDTPMDSSVKLAGDTGDFFPDIGRYRRLVGKLIYLTVTHPDITYAVGVVSQFMHAPRQPHFVAVCRILQYLKRAPGRGDADWAGNTTDRRSTSGYCTFVGGNLVTWRSKKQTVVARSSAEAEYRAMAHTVSEMLWAAIFIANNPVFHERTKHIEVDCHFIRDLLLRKQLVTPYVRSEDQLGDILTKPLARPSFLRLSAKLGMYESWSFKLSKYDSSSTLRSG
ncbi:hypothetical protein CsSME_00020702 [Camellia sinensis var. sinensis]